MIKAAKTIRAAIYCRKSHEEGLDQSFNSLDSQRLAGESFIASQSGEGWVAIVKRYDDPGFSGGTLDRPALNELMDDIRAGKIDVVAVYKVDRLSRSLLDFARLISLFDEYKVSFVSVTQNFSTTSSMGRLTLNILLSFAQFERELTGERIRDKKLATAKLGKYIGGQPKLGLDIVDRKYVINEDEALLVRRIFKMSLELQSCRKIAEALNAEGLRTKSFVTKTGKNFGGTPWTSRNVYDVLTDEKYIGRIVHKGVGYPAEHKAIIADALFNKAKEILAFNRSYTHKHQTSRFSLLRRMLRCGECGSLVMPAWTRNHGREYRYYTCARKVKTGFSKCTLPSLPGGELEKIVVDQLRGVLRHPDVIARTFREVCASGDNGHEPEAVSRLEDLRGRRHQASQAVRSLLGLKDPESPMVQSELKRLNGEIKSLEASIRNLEAHDGPPREIELADVTDALTRLDPVWEILYPEEQRRNMELLVETVTVTKDEVEIRFRTNGLGQIVHELEPMKGETNGKAKVHA